MGAPPGGPLGTPAGQAEKAGRLVSERVHRHTQTQCHTHNHAWPNTEATTLTHTHSLLWGQSARMARENGIRHSRFSVPVLGTSSRPQDRRQRSATPCTTAVPQPGQVVRQLSRKKRLFRKPLAKAAKSRNHNVQKVRERSCGRHAAAENGNGGNERGNDMTGFSSFPRFLGPNSLILLCPEMEPPRERSFFAPLEHVGDPAVWPPGVRWGLGLTETMSQTPGSMVSVGWARPTFSA